MDVRLKMDYGIQLEFEDLQNLFSSIEKQFSDDLGLLLYTKENIKKFNLNKDDPQVETAIFDFIDNLKETISSYERQNVIYMTMEKQNKGKEDDLIDG